MHDDDVPVGEMRWFRPHRDEIDAVMSDERFDGDLTEVAGIVHDLRSAYLSDEQLTRSPALAAFTEVLLDDNGDPLATTASNANRSGSQTAVLPNRDSDQEGHRSMLKALTAVTAGVAGKIALGGAVAAASVGGLHAADIVEVPGLPDNDNRPAFVQDAFDSGDVPEPDVPKPDVPPDPPEPDVPKPDVPPDPPESAVQEVETDDEAEADEPSEFSLAMQEWSECVDEASAEHDAYTATYDASGGNPPGRFDPEAVCGERPINPAITTSETPVGPPEGTPVGPPDGTPVEAPEGTPVGPPDGTPVEAPEVTPVAPPEGTPVEAPEVTPVAPPEGTPVAPPEGAPVDAPVGRP